MNKSEYEGRADALDRSPNGWDDDGLAARSTSACSLAMTSVGDRVQVVSLRGDSQMNRRLIDMGISVNVQGTVVSRADGGLVVFALEGCRLGLGATMAQQIFVKVLYRSSADKSPLNTSSFSTVFRSFEPSMDQTTSAKLHAKSPSQPLSELSVGDSGSVVGYESDNWAYRKKLLAMGLTPGTTFTITHQAPMGDPLELQVRGFKLSLRKREAAVLQVVPDFLDDSPSVDSLVNDAPADEMTNLEPS